MRDTITPSRSEVINLSRQISRCFNRAYLRLGEAKQALDEWSTFFWEARDDMVINRNILALANDFTRCPDQNCKASRHLFAAAITPRGLDSRLESLLDKSFVYYGVKGSPGSGVKELLSYTAQQLKLQGSYAEIYHNPLVPEEIDLIVVPTQKLVMADVSDHVLDYTGSLPGVKCKRWLDFDDLVNAALINANQSSIENARRRVQQNLEAAIAYIAQAKDIHDRLERYYVPAMDFEEIDLYREALQNELRSYFT